MTTQAERLATIEAILERVEAKLDTVEGKVDRDIADLAALKNKGTGLLIGVGLAGGTIGAAVAMGAGAVEDASFRTADNSTITLSYADGLAALLAMAAWGKAVMGRSWALKDAVAVAEDMAALAAIDIGAGWP